jgi:hypothetical protein
LPNGVQPYSAYAAIMVYLDGGVYTDQIANTDQAAAENCELLLFGTDYPANVLLLQDYQSVLYSAGGAALPLTSLSIPVEGRSTDNIAAILPSVAPAVPSITHYKQIVTGTTLTNGVRVSGFPMAAPVGGSLLYNSVDGNTGDPAPVTWFLYGLLNGAVISSSTIQVALLDPAGSNAPNVPIILWEGNFTQQMADDGFKFTAALGLGNAVFDVVGLWGISGFTPAPPPPSLEIGRRAGPPPSRIQQQIERLRALSPAPPPPSLDIGRMATPRLSPFQKQLELIFAPK